MADPMGFLKYTRRAGKYRPVAERVRDHREVEVKRTAEQTEEQASRCMDCGTPFCHWACPLGNHIPDWNNFVFEGHWEKAFYMLDATNNLPEITGRLCPALCEHGCVLGINDDAVTIRENELGIIEEAFKRGIVKAEEPGVKTGKRVAVIGSGPAGLACAHQLSRAGHGVTVYEKDDKIGGLLRYGIPDFKLEKHIIDRRLELMKLQGIKFVANACVGGNVDARELLKKSDAVCLATGSRVPRDLKIKGRETEGIYFAMEYLTQANRIRQGGKIPPEQRIDAGGKKVVVIGGGDTGSDCVGTANRQGASRVVQIEVMPKPDECRTDDYPWPLYPLLLKTSSSHEEGAMREWSILTREFISSGGRLSKLKCVRVEFEKTGRDSCPVMKELPGSEFEIEADMALIAVGFVHPEHDGLLEKLGVELDQSGNIKTDEGYRTSLDKVFSAGDSRRGQSLIVWAISEGRKAAHNIDKFLMKQSALPDF